jgi:DNA-binding transcriptional ArsR family regulator
MEIRRNGQPCQVQEEIAGVFLPNEPGRNELVITKVLYALSDDVRLSIVRKLDEAGPCTCGVFEVDRPKSSLSHHFRVLRESGVVATTRQGTALLNTLRREDLDARFPNLLNAVLERPSRPVRVRKSAARRQSI